MPSNKTENYLRLHLLNNEAVEALRATFLKIVRNTSNGDVDQFLKEFEEDIKTMHKLSYGQRKILFPDNGRTNVDDWDVTLLSFILIICCSLEGKICISKLRELMKKQISAFTDITSFLAYNKARIDQMRGEEVIDDTQHNKLFSKSTLNDWDIHLLLSMLIAFSSGQNKVKLYSMLRNCVARDVRLHCLNPNLTDYLTRKQSECKTMLQNGTISHHEYNQLFPKLGVISDVNNWDKHLINVFVTNICVGLGSDTMKAVCVVRQIRNEMLAHKGTAEMENGDFLMTWTNLKQAIEEIIKQEVPNMMQEWINKLNQLHSGPFDISGAINILQAYYCKETSEFNSIIGFINDIEHKIEVANKQREVEYKCGQQERDKLIKINEDIAKKVQYLVDQDKSKDVYTEAIEAERIDIKIHVASGNEHSKQKTENAIRLAIQNILKGSPAEIKIQTVIKLVEGMTRDGTEIEAVQSGSVLLKVKCISLKGLTNLLIHTESEALRKEMEDELAKTIDEDIRLGCGITEESKHTIIGNLDRIKTEYEMKKPLVVSNIDSDSLMQETDEMSYIDGGIENANALPSQSVHTASTTTTTKETDEIAPPDTDHDTSEDQSQSILTEDSSATAVAATTIPPKNIADIAQSEIEAESISEAPKQPLLGEALTDATPTTTQNVPKAEKIHTFSIKCRGDQYNCHIFSCTVLPTGDIVVCDDENDNVKLFDKHYTYRSVLELHYDPYDSCLSGEDNTEVLVTVPSTKTIYRIKVGDDMEVKDEIVVGYQCYGITCCRVGIAVIIGYSGGYIQLLQYDGTTIRRVATNIQLRYTSYVTSIMNGRQLVISDTGSSHVLSLDVDTGKTVFEYKDDDLGSPSTVTSDSQDNIYVVGWYSNNVHMISSTGEKVVDILTRTYGLNLPRALEYNRYNDTILLQADSYNDEMCVYTIIK